MSSYFYMRFPAFKCLFCRSRVQVASWARAFIMANHVTSQSQVRDRKPWTKKMARRLILQQVKTANLATMTSLLRTFSITTGLLHSARAFKPFMASPVSTWMGWLSKPAIAGSLQQTRGMKVHSSVKKRCEHCKVGWKWIYKHYSRYKQWGTCSWANDQIYRLFDERPESDTTDTCTSSARRILDTSSDRAKQLQTFCSFYFDDGDIWASGTAGNFVQYWRINGDDEMGRRAKIKQGRV